MVYSPWFITQGIWLKAHRLWLIAQAHDVSTAGLSLSTEPLKPLNSLYNCVFGGKVAHVSESICQSQVYLCSAIRQSSTYLSLPHTTNTGKSI
ncbi:unnamed protein product [Lactuca virosa]|uniref:Uncharacterized protein n=1 Tax=Lactuca virosa TaxID=75947 RepID=A0AAU9M627_9ASTR|nr:unnamed protein product [Lactuca virosa]